MADFVWNSRKTFRVTFESQASFRLHRTFKKDIRLKNKTIEGGLIDVSLGGCALESPNFVPTGVKLNIFVDRNILVPAPERTKKARPTKIVGIIRTVRQLANRRYRLGVQFEKISSEDVKLIRVFIDRYERREDIRVHFPSK